MFRVVIRAAAALSLALVALVVAPSPASAASQPFEQCDPPSNQSLTIQTVDVTPYPVVAGKKATITVSGTLNQTVLSGAYTAKIYYLGIQVMSTTGPLSDLAPTPWAAGPIVLTSSFKVPSTAPSGDYHVQLSLVDLNGQDLSCAQFSVAVS